MTGFRRTIEFFGLLAWVVMCDVLGLFAGDILASVLYEWTR